MNIVLPIEEVKINNTYFGEPIVNTVMDDSKFIKSKTSSNNTITYFLASDNFEKLQQLVNHLEKENKIFQYQLNSG